MNMQLMPTRQVHLDFHTSQYIEGIAEDFDAAAFAETVAAAHINSMTVFARCHHGYLYYPSKVFPERVHPNLSCADLLVQQVEALHACGVRAPIYVTVQWDLYTASRHPEWLVRKKDGAHHGGAFWEPGFYQSLCVNTGYIDFLKAHVAEICALFGGAADGFFFDIVMPQACYCASCRAKMQAQGIDLSDDAAVWAFGKESIDRFKLDMTAFIRERNAECTVFYNMGHVAPSVKSCAEAYTHFELESLPSGQWGYLHFPVAARFARTLGKDCLGMTGKFHTEWGDFHSLKNLAALEYECFRMLSLGLGCSIGDQLEPNGRLNAATYRLIGKVYGQVAVREEWARPSVPVVEAAVLTNETLLGDRMTSEAVKGAAQMLDELAVQFDIIDWAQDFGKYKLLILPGDWICTGGQQAKLDEYAAQGGCIIACGKGGLNAAGAYPSCFGAKWLGDEALYPSFLVADGALAEGLELDNEYVIYKQGQSIAGDGAAVVMLKRHPYFSRESGRFCSHRYTPSDKGAVHPAVLRNGNVILFAHPVFDQYRANAPFWCKRVIANAVDALLPARLVRHDGPSTLSVTILDQPQKGRMNLHVLSYIPVRKSADIDIIEERTVQRNICVTLHVPQAIKTARLVPSGEMLPMEGNAFVIPEVDGYAIVELAY